MTEEQEQLAKLYGAQLAALSDLIDDVVMTAVYMTLCEQAPDIKDAPPLVPAVVESQLGHVAKLLHATAETLTSDTLRQGVINGTLTTIKAVVAFRSGTNELLPPSMRYN